MFDFITHIKELNILILNLREKMKTGFKMNDKETLSEKVWNDFYGVSKSYPN